jgi:hypothetical protein
MLPTGYRPVMVPQWERRHNMHVPIPGVIDDPCSGFDQPHGDPFDGSARFFAPAKSMKMDLLKFGRIASFCASPFPSIAWTSDFIDILFHIK